MGNKNVVIIGAGRSGRGYVGELYSGEGYKITYIDKNKELVKAMKEQGSYKVYKYSEDHKEEVKVIKDYDVLHPQENREEYLEALINADLISTATYPDGFDAIIEDIVELVRKKISINDTTQQAITLGANYIGILQYFEAGLQKSLSDEEINYQKKYTPLVESIILRASTYPSALQEHDDSLAIQGDDWDYLQVEQSAFNFRAGFTVPNFFLMEDDVLKLMYLKIWIGNTLHCSYAFLGHYHGLKYTYESTRHDYVSRCAFYASNEGYRALAIKYGLPLPQPKEEIDETINYYKNESLKDSLLRVAANPIRKLGRNERFIGPALLCMEYGVLPAFICRNAAYGFVYKNESDLESVELMQMVKDNGIEKTVEKVCQLDLSNEKEKLIHGLIVAQYKAICDENPVR